jgi:carbon storage regulator
MLVLERNLDQVVVIGDAITVQVIRVRGNKVRLGIVAPGLEVDRLEVREQKLARRRAEEEGL